jgi:HK97 family phage major capsid protein
MLYGTININDPQSISSRAQILVNKKPFTKEDKAEFDALLGLLDHIQRRAASDANVFPLPRSARLYGPPEEIIAQVHYLRTGDQMPLSKYHEKRQAEQRDMNVATDSAGGLFVPTGIAAQVMSAMKAYDRLFDSDVITIVESPHGNQWAYPLSDDTSATASIAAEDTQDTEIDPQPDSLVLPKAPTWRTGMVKVSLELAQDSAFPIDEYVSKNFGPQLARGIGAANVAALMSKASQGAIASGSASNDGSGATGANSVGTDDLYALMASVNPAYLASPQCGWLMSFATLIKLLTLKDKQGRPIIPPASNESGDFVLLTKPVYICPGMDSIATGKKPIAFGAMNYFVMRVVKGGIAVQRFTERYIDQGQLAYRAFMRANGGLGKAASADSPVKYLQNA